jgi:hypothetical protein
VAIDLTKAPENKSPEKSSSSLKIGFESKLARPRTAMATIPIQKPERKTLVGNKTVSEIVVYDKSDLKPSKKYANVASKLFTQVLQPLSMAKVASQLGTKNMLSK